MRAKAQAEACGGRHGLSNPLPLVIACRCVGCEGELHADVINARVTRGYLICSVCRCTYAITASSRVEAK